MSPYVDRPHDSVYVVIYVQPVWNMILEFGLNFLRQIQHMQHVARQMLLCLPCWELKKVWVWMKRVSVIFYCFYLNPQSFSSLLWITCFHYFFHFFIRKKWLIPIIWDAALIKDMLRQQFLYRTYLPPFPIFENGMSLPYDLSYCPFQHQNLLFCLVRGSIKFLIIMIFFLSSTSRKSWFLVGIAKWYRARVCMYVGLVSESP